MLSGTPLATLLIAILPSSFADWLDPEGGANIVLPLFALSAWLQFVALFSVASAILIRRLEKNRQ